MKYCFGLFFFFYVFSKIAYAHGLGEQEFFTINGQYARLYPVLSTSLKTLTLPDDIAPQVYVVGQPIRFAIDTNQLPLSEEVITKTQFFWDFGDGQKGEGLFNTHTYTTFGTYTLTIHAFYQDEKSTSKDKIQSLMLHVVPDTTYVLPKSVISINGRSIHDLLVDIFAFRKGETLTFDASRSTPSGAIASYLWDFGDSLSATEKTVKHQYANNYRIVFPMLRVVDTNGFISDSYAQLTETSSQISPISNKIDNDKKDFFSYMYLLAGIIVIGGSVVFIKTMKRK